MLTMDLSTNHFVNMRADISQRLMNEVLEIIIICNVVIPFEHILPRHC